MERGQRRITINYAKRQQGRRVYAAQSSHLPLKVNMAGVIRRSSSSILLFRLRLANGLVSLAMEWLQDVALVPGPGPLYILLFDGNVFFCYFYTAIVFNPRDVAIT